MTFLRLRVALLFVLASCRGSAGAVCSKDDECGAALVCHFGRCAGKAADAHTEEKARINARNERARVFLKRKLRMSDAEATNLSISGQRLVIAHGATNMEFCLEPNPLDGESFKILFAGSAGAKLCGGMADDKLSFGDVVGAGGP